MNDAAPDPDELREAEALARALDEKPANAPVDALEVAALLRYARGGDEAPPALLSRAKSRATRGRFRLLGFVAGGFAAAAALWLVFAPMRSHEPPPSSDLDALLRAQGEALAHPDAPLTELGEAARRHRRALFARVPRGGS